MSNFVYNKGYIYPITNEEYKRLGEKYSDLESKGFDLTVFDGQIGPNRYLIFLTYHSYGEKNDYFGYSRFCNQQEISYLTVKFRKILGEIDTAKLKYIEYCWYNSTECFDYYEEEDNDTNFTIQQAIAQCKEFAKETKIFAADPHAAKIAEYLQKLVDYEDETPITEKWLQANGFSESGWMKIGDILICCYKTGRERWFASVDDDDRNFHEKFGHVKTLGQLRMFLTLCGLGDFVKQLKS